MSQRKSVFSDILRKNKEPEPKAASAKEIEESEELNSQSGNRPRTKKNSTKQLPRITLS